MHDSTIDRTTNGTGIPSNYTYAELQEFYIDGGNGWDAKYANQLKIPKLTEYLAICKKFCKKNLHFSHKTLDFFPVFY